MKQTPKVVLRKLKEMHEKLTLDVNVPNREFKRWVGDERFANVGSVMKNRPDFHLAMAEAFSQFTLGEASARLEAAGVTFSRVTPMGDILEDEQMRANDIVVETGDDGEGYPLTINSPINVAESPKRKPARAPDIGADSLSVLRELGIEEQRIQTLLTNEVIFTAEPKAQEGS